MRTCVNDIYVALKAGAAVFSASDLYFSSLTRQVCISTVRSSFFHPAEPSVLLCPHSRYREGRKYRSPTSGVVPARSSRISSHRNLDSTFRYHLLGSFQVVCFLRQARFSKVSADDRS